MRIKDQQLAPDQTVGALSLELVQKAQAGDVKARNRLVELTYKLVVKRATAAAKRARKVEHLEDIISTAIVGANENDGLIHAIEKFDMSRGLRFSTYAVRWIDNAIQNAIASTDVVRVGRYAHGEVGLRTIVADLTLEDGTQPTAREVRARCVFHGMRPPSDKAIERALTHVRAEEMPTEESAAQRDAQHGKRRQLGDLRALASDEDLGAALEDRELGRQLLAAIKALTDDQRMVLVASFGLLDEAQRDTAEISERYGMSLRAVARLRQEALDSLYLACNGEPQRNSSGEPIKEAA